MINFNPLSDGIFIHLWWMIPIAAVFFLANSLRNKKLVGRFTANFRAQCKLNAEIYHEINKLDVRSGSEHLQVDHVYISRHGIFVVNTPNQQGLIWGDKKDGLWTQRYHKSESQFPNPLRQNQRYIEALSKQLSLPQQVFFSVAVFGKNCRFQTMMPDNVVESFDFVEYVSQYEEILLSDEEVVQIRKTLETNEFDVVFAKQSVGVYTL
ncbi:nuclease-related domain-containing protein [Neisseria chenwenguii]|uniref:DNA-binding protein n=1 Tax=Neisseria chenwenguii TaxID=1853278 RepID=A0A220S560_9NEIS|nr:nuclease-related domain-containing protein [Neisseria chenwenguii]ASK28428.1 DNA-binding protein [Neisseria chenwenguii]ROV56749.1 NERD domain-containing protein [Neisseria chenwenguii]